MSSLTPRPHKPTGAEEDGRQGRCLGGDHVGVVAASLPGVERWVEPKEKNVIVVFVGTTGALPRLKKTMTKWGLPERSFQGELTDCI